MHERSSTPIPTTPLTCSTPDLLDVDVIIVQDSENLDIDDGTRLLTVIEGHAKSPFEPEDDECPICFETITIAAELSECQHRFCLACLVDWRNKVMTKKRSTTFPCPFCRAECKITNATDVEAWIEYEVQETEAEIWWIDATSQLETVVSLMDWIFSKLSSAFHIGLDLLEGDEIGPGSIRLPDRDEELVDMMTRRGWRDRVRTLVS